MMILIMSRLTIWWKSIPAPSLLVSDNFGQGRPISLQGTEIVPAMPLSSTAKAIWIRCKGADVRRNSDACLTSRMEDVMMNALDLFNDFHKTIVELNFSDRMLGYC